MRAVVARIESDLDAVLQDDFDASDLQGIAACLQQSRCLSTASVSTTPGPLLAKGNVVGLHAAAAFDGRDRKRLRRQLAYMLRPPFAMNNITRQTDGMVRLTFSHPCAHGSAFTDLSPHAFLARLAALVPFPRFNPRFNVVRYRGVFSSRHHLRATLAYQSPDAPTVVAHRRRPSVITDKNGLSALRSPLFPLAHRAFGVPAVVSEGQPHPAARRFFRFVPPARTTTSSAVGCRKCRPARSPAPRGRACRPSADKEGLAAQVRDRIGVEDSVTKRTK